MADHRSRLTPIAGTYQWIMFPYRALAVMGDAFMRWITDALRRPAK